MKLFADWLGQHILGFSGLLVSLLGVTLPVQASPLVGLPVLCTAKSRALCFTSASQPKSAIRVQGRVAQSSLPLIKLEPHPIASGSDFVRSCQSNTLVFDQQKTDDIFASPSTGVSQIGDLQIEQKNFSAAVKALRSAVALEPENAEFHLALGCSLEKLGDYAAAENAYRQATKLESNNPVAYFGLGTTLAKQEKFRAALFAYSIALVLKPEEPRTYQAVGSIYEKLGKPADAAHFFQKANYLTVISQNHERL